MKHYWDLFSDFLLLWAQPSHERHESHWQPVRRRCWNNSLSLNWRNSYSLHVGKPNSITVRVRDWKTVDKKLVILPKMVTTNLRPDLGCIQTCRVLFFYGINPSNCTRIGQNKWAEMRKVGPGWLPFTSGVIYLRWESKWTNHQYFVMWFQKLNYLNIHLLIWIWICSGSVLINNFGIIHSYVCLYKSFGDHGNIYAD